MKELLRGNKGITLIALIITVIVLLLLAGATINVIKTGNIFGNTEKVVSQTQIEAKRQEIEEIIVNKMIKADSDITMDDIMEELVKKGITEEGKYNSDSEQVKTIPEGYVYQITEEKSGWEVEYIGTGEIEKSAFTISLNSSTEEATNKVVITIKGEATAGIATYTDAEGTETTYSGETSITETYTVTENGTYTFTIENSKGRTVSKEITISNIVTESITMVATPSTPTTGNVEVTVTWPEGSSNGIKQISTNGGSSWSTYTGAVTVSENCTVKARLTNTSEEEVKTATLTINNIDKTSPTITVSSESIEITQGDSNLISTYFTTKANGTTKIASTTYTDENGKEISNTNTLEVGEHTITCTVTKETGATASKSITITVSKAKVLGTVVVDGETVEITTANVDKFYGATIKNYTPSGVETDVGWKIFYVSTKGEDIEGDTESGHIYLIADNYVERSTLPAKNSKSPDTDSSGFARTAYFSNVYGQYTNGSGDITDTRLKALNSSFYSYLETNNTTSTYENIKSVAYMMDTSIWKTFKDSTGYADYVVGGPSVEMLMESYSNKHSVDYQAKATSSTGYQISKDGGSNWAAIYYIGMLSTSDSLYVLSSPADAYGYWLSSPSAYSHSYVLNVNSSGYVNVTEYDSEQLVNYRLPSASLSKI